MLTFMTDSSIYFYKTIFEFCRDSIANIAENEAVNIYDENGYLIVSDSFQNISMIMVDGLYAWNANSIVNDAICNCDQGLSVEYTHGNYSENGVGYQTVYCPNCNAIDRVIYDDDSNR